MAWHDGVKTGIGRPALAGFAMLTMGFGGFGAWAALAPLEGAVIAPGTVVASGRNKAVQHLEGGIVRDILVAEGDRVETGDPLLVLEATSAEAMRNRIAIQLTTMSTLEARALAERDGAHAITFPQSILAQAHRPEIAETIADQRAEFGARLDRHRTELAILEQQIAALHDEITGMQAQKQAVELQLELIREEKADSEALLKKGLTKKTRVLELRRAEADLLGRAGQLAAGVAKARQGIAEARQQIQRCEVTRVEEAVAQLSELRLQRADVLERLRTAQDVLDRLIVRAPASGTVMTLTKYHPGAVITPGQDLMQIVPEDSGLVVETHIRPQDIDHVRIGQPARLGFAALDRRETPPVPGEVVHISADRLQDGRTGEVYYLARLRISSEPLQGFDPERIGPGQPVEAFITTGKRTFAAYLAEPITQALRRAFRES